jgi:hypothetical protein
MNKTIKGFLIGVVTTAVFTTSGLAMASNGYFQDNGWWTPAAEWAKDQGLMTGLGNGYFGGEQTVTRGQLAQVLKNLADTGVITVNKSQQPVTTTPTPTSTSTSAPTPAPTANEITLGTGTFYVGKDINAGRYVVSTTNNGGNFFVTDPSGISSVNEILGTDPSYVNNITIDLVNGQNIKISGLQSVKFTPKA